MTDPEDVVKIARTELPAVIALVKITRNIKRNWQSVKLPLKKKKISRGL